MLYIEINEDSPDDLSYYCRKCGYKEGVEDDNEYCISTINVKKKNEKTGSNINKYTKQDPLLPTINIPCPNKQCGSSEVIYVRFNEISMNYSYICKECNTTWNVEN
tara:strand:- start:376 stop:693 length:318 start_codon:yes stop_codon:yes gene_type:complete